MKRLVTLLLFIISLFSVAHSQSAKKLYKLYNDRDFVKCVQKCDVVITKDPNFYEAYYVKSIAYFEMAQLPQRYTDFTKDPLMDCLKTLSVLRAKDPDGGMFDEHADTLQMMYKYFEAKAQELRTLNKDKSILMYQRMTRAYNLQSNALELALIYAKVGDYEKCMQQVSHLYEKCKPDISTSSEDYDALTKGAVLLAQNWMFRDLFWIIETYKPKYESNYAISQGFRKALKIAIDTARHDDDKTFFQDFSKQGAMLYPNDEDILSHIENRWVELIDASAQKYRDTKVNNPRTWRDSVLLRDTYKYIEMAKEIMPGDVVFLQKEKKLNAEFHIVPFTFEEVYFKRLSLEIVNRWRTEGCMCDTGTIFNVLPVPEIQWSETLAQLAQGQAKEMFCYNYTDNINLAGKTPWDRIKQTDLKGMTYENEVGLNYKEATKIGEILGYGFSFDGVYSEEDMQKVIEKVVQRWIEQRLTQNCPKLMTPDFTHMGMAMYGDKWVLFCATVNDIVIKKNRKK